MNNIVLSNSVNTQNYEPVFQKPKRAKTVYIDKTPEEKLNRIYRSQGMLGKFFDKIQGTLGVGLSKSKLQKELNKTPADKFDKKLNQYYDQQKNEAEIAMDLMTGVSAAGTFRLIKKAQTYSHLYTKNKKFEAISSLVGLGVSAIAGMITKPLLRGINGIGMSKKDKKQERTILKDMGSGFIDGAAAPLAYAYKLGLAGAVAINSASRYAFNKKADKDSGFAEHLSNGWLVKVPALGLAAFSAFKFHKRIDVLEKAIAKSKENVKNIKNFESKMPLTELADLAKSNLRDNKTQHDLIAATKKGFFSKTYMTLTMPLRKLFGDKIHPAIESLELTGKPLFRTTFMTKSLIKEKEMNNIMREIEQYNIFYPKMIQAMPSNIGTLANLAGEGKNPLNKIIDENIDIKSGNWFTRRLKKMHANRMKYISEKGIDAVNDFLNKYKSSCPASRTAKEAQKYVADTYGKKYTIIGDKPLGVGTIAETFLAKDNETGKEVVVKMIKKWVSADKLKADKENMLKSLERVKNKIKPDEYEYQKKLVNELYGAWSKEIDLKLEADAAKTLGKYAVNYNTVAPISVKNNIFVMEKANGVQFDKLTEYLKDNNIKLTMDEAADLMRSYVQVFFEQLLSVPQKGQKVMHADPHAGNIFIDLKNKAKPFTFIDTGNVMRFTPEEAIQNVTSHIDYLIGNSKSIAQRLLKGATLPEGMDEKKAVDMLAKHLDETFYSGKNRIVSDPFSTINNESVEFMKKNKVILNSQNTNLLKAEITYLMNMVSVADIVKHIDKNSKFNDLEQQEKMKLMMKQLGQSLQNSVMNNKKCTAKEVYSRYKYFKDNPEKIFTTLYSYVPPKN